MKRKMPFPFDFEASEVMESFSEAVRARVDERRGEIIDSRNVQRFRHGGAWQSHHSYDPDKVTHLDAHEGQVVTSFDDIASGRLEAVEEGVARLAESLYVSMFKTLFKTVSDVCEEHGMVVSAKNSGFAQAFVEMLEKIEFGVNRDGEVSIPQLVVGSDIAKAIQEGRCGLGELEQKAEEIKSRKCAEALARERERKSKFVGGGNGA